MTQVYDWIGSLSTVPEHFNLLDYQMKIVSPQLKVFVGIFNMVESDVPILMSPSGEVAFAGFGTTNNISTTHSYTDASDKCSTQQYDKLNEVVATEKIDKTHHL